jgi:hypothetical protein
LFPISVWNQFDNDGSRTNNTVEGYILKLNNFLTSPAIANSPMKNMHVFS